MAGAIDELQDYEMGAGPRQLSPTARESTIPH